MNVPSQAPKRPERALESAANEHNTGPVGITGRIRASVVWNRTSDLQNLPHAASAGRPVGQTSGGWCRLSFPLRPNFV